MEKQGLPAFMSEMLSRIVRVARPKVKFGVLGTVRKVFSVDLGVAQYAAFRDSLAGHPLVELVPTDDDYPGGIIWAGQLNATDQVARKFMAADVDGVIIVPLNYGDEEAAAEIANRVHRALRCPIATFCFPEVPILPDGRRQLDDGCGIYPMRQEMRKRMGRSPAYIPKAPLDSDEFTDGLMKFIQVCSGIRAMRSVRGIQVGADQPTFYAIQSNKDELADRFNFRHETFDAGVFRQMLADGLTTQPAWFKEVLAWVKGRVDYSKVESKFPNTAPYTALGLGYLLQMLAEKESNSISINCWDEVQKLMGFMVCGINGLAFELGIMAACETDWPGNIGCALLQGLAIGNKEVVCCFADLTRLEHDTGKIMWWHCGPFPPGKVCGGCQACEGWIFPLPEGCAGLLGGKWGEIGDKVTMAQVRPDGNGVLTLVATNGAIVGGTETIGTHFWTRMSDVRKFEAWSMKNPVDHHNSVVLGGDMLPVLPDVAEWTELPYTEYDNLKE